MSHGAAATVIAAQHLLQAQVQWLQRPVTPLPTRHDRLARNGRLAGRWLIRLSLDDLTFPDLPVQEGIVHRHVGDLADSAALDAALCGAAPDAVFRLARPPARTGQWEAFLSDIIRELAAGRPFICRTSPGATTWASSLPNVVDKLIHAPRIDLAPGGGRRTYTLPTARFSMADLVSAIAEVHGTDAKGLARFEADAAIEARFGQLSNLEACPASEGPRSSELYATNFSAFILGRILALNEPYP